jgi:hypothetical protein
MPEAAYIQESLVEAQTFDTRSERVKDLEHTFRHVSVQTMRWRNHLQFGAHRKGDTGGLGRSDSKSACFIRSAGDNAPFPGAADGDRPTVQVGSGQAFHLDKKRIHIYMEDGLGPHAISKIPDLGDRTGQTTGQCQHLFIW